MKKLLTLALCSIMVLGLGSCSKKNSSSNPISSNPDTTDTSTPDSSSEESSDTGTSDTGSTDSGSTDSGSSDSGSTDSGSTDSGSTDSGSTDSGSGDTTTETFTIYFQNNWAWSDIRAYVFDSTISEGVNYEVEWPGASLTSNYKDGDGANLHDMYELELPVDTTYDSVIFNGWDAGKWNETTQENGTSNQTPDIKFADLVAAGHNTVYLVWDETTNANSYGSYNFVPTPAYESYSISVNETDVTTEATVDKGSDYAKFTTTLEVGDVVVIKGETTDLETYTATVAGEHTFTVNIKNVVSVIAPKDPNAETFTYTVSMPWNGFSDNAKIYAWVWGTGVEATWVECTDGGDNKIVFVTEEANYTHCIPMRMPSETTTPGWNGAWNRGSSQQSGHADIAFTDYAATAYWVNP